jgi:hypothetical protein
MIGQDRRKEILGRLEAAAKLAGLYVAPIGSSYYFLQQPSGLETKDFDAVIHADDLAVAELDAVVEMAKGLGVHEVSQDRAVVTVYLDGPKGDPNASMVELIRGRPRSNDGFLPRPLLKEAGRLARRSGRVLWYPTEFVLMMKADAAADRQERAEKGGRFFEENQRRAATFRADVFREVQANEAKIDTGRLAKALALIKESRRVRVADLIASASAGRIKLR